MIWKFEFGTDAFSLHVQLKPSISAYNLFQVLRRHIIPHKVISLEGMSGSATGQFYIADNGDEIKVSKESANGKFVTKTRPANIQTLLTTVQIETFLLKLFLFSMWVHVSTVSAMRS